jgi:hypothetical protein
MLLIISPNTWIADGDEAYVQLLSGERLIQIVRRVPDGFLLESATPLYLARGEARGSRRFCRTKAELRP